MATIRHICKYNKNYRKELEAVLLEAAPELHGLEPKLIQYIHGYIDLDQDGISECMRCIAEAVAAVPDYVITIEGIESIVPDRILRWSREDILKERFAYLRNLSRKMTAFQEEEIP